MNSSIGKILVAATFAFTVSTHANASVQTKSIIVESPSDLPEMAQGHIDAMYLQHTHEAQAILYLEQDHGKKLTILDVTDPAKIKAVGQIAIDAPSAYDFVQNLGDSRALIHYRNHAGFAVISFREYQQPVLTAEPEYLHPATPEADGSNGLLLVSSKSPAANRTAPTSNSDYEVLNISSSAGSAPVATIHGVFQRVDRPQTGTIFLLNNQGLTIVRCLGAEQRHQEDIRAREVE